VPDPLGEPAGAAPDPVAAEALPDVVLELGAVPTARRSAATVSFATSVVAEAVSPCSVLMLGIEGAVGSGGGSRTGAAGSFGTEMLGACTVGTGPRLGTSTVGSCAPATPMFVIPPPRTPSTATQSTIDRLKPAPFPAIWGINGGGLANLPFR
jgi:hypothetical protein